MNDEKIQNHFFSSNFYKRGNIGWGLFVLPVTTQVVLGNKSLPKLLDS